MHISPIHCAAPHFRSRPCSSQTRNTTDGSVLPNNKFPNGIKALADFVHARGLKFGIYTDIGNKTCGGGSGILGHEHADAAKYAEWGVDLVKNDDCHHATNTTAAYEATWKALVATGRPMIHMTKASLDVSSPLARTFAQARRVSKDITWLWPRIKSLVYQQQSWSSNLSNISGVQPLSGNGFWNDMDMMEIGNAGVGAYQGIWQNLSFAESRTHFALWSLLKSPMILGCDLTAQRPDVIEVLRNGEATAMNQDKLGVQATMLASTNVTEPEAYMLLKPCNATVDRQVGWFIDPLSTAGATRDATPGVVEVAVKTKQDRCISAAWPMYDAFVAPCNTSDTRQTWVWNSTAGTLRTSIVYTTAQPTCLVAAFAHVLRGSSVKVGICRANGPVWNVRPDGTLASSLGPIATDIGDRKTGPKTGPGVTKPTQECVERVDATPMERALGIGQLQVYGGPLSPRGEWGVGLVNMDTMHSRNITLQWKDLPGNVHPSAKFVVRDVWAKRNVPGTHSGSFTVRVNPHDTALIRLVPA